MTPRAQKPGLTSRGPSYPFSRPFDVRRIPDGGMRQEIEASEAERAALADAMSLPAIGSLKARFELRRRAGGRVVVEGQVDADVTQTCVVTLEGFETRVRHEVEMVFSPAVPDETVRSRRGDFEVQAMRPVPGSDDQADPPDPIVDDAVDLGAIAAEFLALALDPYPRKPGVAFEDVVDPRDDEPSAFAALERLKAGS